MASLYATMTDVLRWPTEKPWYGVGGGLAVVCLITAVLRAAYHAGPATIPALLLLVPVAAASAIAGWRLSMLVAVSAAAAYALAFLPPVGSIRIALTEDVLVLVAFVLVAVTVSALAQRRIPPSNDSANATLLDQGRAELLRSVSHDLRNPLNTIRTVSSDLLDSTVGYDEHTRAELLGLVVRESDRLDRIVGNMLSVSQVQAGGLRPHCDAESIDDLIHRCVDRFHRLGIDNVTTDVDRALPDVSVDAIQIDQVLTNLVENAVRHAPAATDVAVQARRAPDHRYVEVTVIDHGPGFPAIGVASVAPIRGSARNGRAPRTGIGLMVCQAIVTAHGGTLAMRDSPTGGARVSFTIPVDD